MIDEGSKSNRFKWIIQNGILTFAISFDALSPVDDYLLSTLSKELVGASVATERFPENCLVAFGSANLN